MFVLLIAGPSADELARLKRLEAYFEEAEKTTGVESDLLRVISYRLTRFYHILPDEKHAHAVPQYGVMGIFHLKEASRVSGLSEDLIRRDERANVLAAAHLLKNYIDMCGGDIVCALQKYAPPGAEKPFARDILLLKRRGIKDAVVHVEPDADLVIPKELLTGDGGDYGLMSCPPGPEFPEVEQWTPAHSSNYTSANRPTDYPIQYMIMHTVQGSYYGAISWFQNSSANVSAHYVLNSECTNCQTNSGTGYNDGAPVGEATQMVCHKDIAWHAGNWTYNTQSIGIEHEGFVEYNGWYTDTLYRKSAYISRSAANTFGFPKDRVHIIGHNEVPGATHTDPGQYWDWGYYMALVNGLPAADTIVDDLSQGFRKYGPSKYWYYDSANGYGLYGHMWHTGSWAGVANWAKWTPNLPVAGQYEVLAYIPSGAQYDAYVPYVIKHAGGVDTVWVDQGNYDGQWASLGIYNFNAGSSDYVILLDSSTISGDRIAFDAIKWHLISGAPSCTTVVDDGDPGWFPYGNWSLSSLPGYNGDYRYATIGSPADSAKWFAPLNCNGGYLVYAWVRKGTNRTTAAHYRIYADDGVHDVYINQYGNSNDTGWIFLDTVCTDTMHVMLYDNAPDGSVVIADAIKFEYDPGVYCSPLGDTTLSVVEGKGDITISYENSEIVLKVPYVQDVTFGIYDVTGKRVYGKVFRSVVGWIRIRPPVGLKRGVYFITANGKAVKVVIR